MKFEPADPTEQTLGGLQIIFFVLIFLSGMASGKRIEAHIIVRRYSWPGLVLGKGPTQSIIILLKGSSKAGIGCK